VKPFSRKFIFRVCAPGARTIISLKISSIQFNFGRWYPQITDI
jgi:hypothetical protein